jgi:hypothetical protein
MAQAPGPVKPTGQRTTPRLGLHSAVLSGDLGPVTCRYRVDRYADFASAVSALAPLGARTAAA